MQNFWKMFKSMPWERQTLWTAAGLAVIPLIFSLLSSWTTAPQKEAPIRSQQEEFDTFIPKGFVLVPIEVQNFESLDSIFGQFGLVDLFQTVGSERVEQRLIARNVRLLRAPHNPSHFAVLVQETRVDKILKFGGAYTVVVKRRSKDGTEFVKEPSKRQIIYDGV
jgi:hypothetical protein